MQIWFCQTTLISIFQLVCTWICFCYHVVVVCVCVCARMILISPRVGTVEMAALSRRLCIGLASLLTRRLRCGVCDLGTELAPFVCFHVRVGDLTQEGWRRPLGCLEGFLYTSIALRNIWIWPRGCVMVIWRFSSDKVPKKSHGMPRCFYRSIKILHVIDFSLKTITAIETCYFDSNVMLWPPSYIMHSCGISDIYDWMQRYICPSSALHITGAAVGLRNRALNADGCLLFWLDAGVPHLLADLRKQLFWGGLLEPSRCFVLILALSN